MDTFIKNKSSSSDVIASANEFCESLNLDLPYIPSSELPKMMEYHEGIYGSKLNPVAIYDILSYVQDILGHPVDDYVMFGFAGHGFNSWAMHYYIVKKNLAAFIQLPLGGFMTDKVEACDRINGAFQAVQYVIKLLAIANQKHLIEANQRLLIIESDFYGKGWGWIKGHPGEIGNEWQTAEPLFLNAISSIPIK